MRIWMIGAGPVGTAALRQLRKNEEIEVVVSAATERPHAVAERVIARVDHVEAVTPININTLARRIRPDLILIDSAAVGGFGRVTGGTALSQALLEEMAAASEYPCLVIGA